MPSLSSCPSQSTGINSRRHFIRQISSIGAALSASWQLSGCEISQAQSLPLHLFDFLHGVASGDPLQDRVIIWTRVTPAASLQLDEKLSLWVQWQLATDSAMQNVQASGSAQTSLEQDFTVKVDVTGLQAGQEYFYRFAIQPPAPQTMRYSRVGRTKTLPAIEVENIRLAVFSCANYPAGYFHVYADAARQAPFDAVLHLGDYIYEYEADGYACQNAEKLGRVSQPKQALMELTDYRQRYAQYRRDPDLQALHAQAPFICVWDDHEFADDTWRDGAEEHDAAMQGPYSLRRAAATAAYHEWLPIRSVEPEKIYRSFDFGQILSLHMLDTRVVGRDQQLQFDSYQDASGGFDLAKLKRDARAPQRQMLGKEQFAWLEQNVTQSRARWQVLGQQVLMARMEFPLPVVLGEVDRFGFANAHASARQMHAAPLSIKQKAWLHAPRVPCYLDSWDGYQAERERVFSLMQRQQKNLVVLAGDTHNAWASDLYDEFGRRVGVEFATAAVSSPGLECSYPDQSAAKVADCMMEMLPGLRYAQTSLRGYMVILANQHELRCDWRFVDTVLQHEFKAETGRSLRVLAGQKKLQEVMSAEP